MLLDCWRGPLSAAGFGMQTMEALTDVDIVSCRAKHAAWLTGVRPSFHTSQDTDGCVQLPGDSPRHLRGAHEVSCN
jgi:hypothetical protein